MLIRIWVPQVCPGQQNKPKDCSPAWFLTGRQFAGEAAKIKLQETWQPLSCWRYSRSFQFCLRYLNVNTEQHINTSVKRCNVYWPGHAAGRSIDSLVTSHPLTAKPEQRWPRSSLEKSKLFFFKKVLLGPILHELIADFCRPAHTAVSLL